MKITIDIKKVTVFSDRGGTDKISIELNGLPNPYCFDGGKAFFTIETNRSRTKEMLSALGIDTYEIIDTKNI